MNSKSGVKICLALTCVVLLLPFTGLYPIMLMKLLCLALFACAFNLLLGFAGLLSFGHAMFFGTSAYVAGYLIKSGLTPELGVLLGTGVSALLGLIVGGMAIRRQGIYFAMITLALSQMIFFLLQQAKFTGGEDGLQGIPRGELFGLISLGNDVTLYYVVAIVFLVSFCAIHRIINSPYGQILKSIRENEPRAISMGYDTKKYKLGAFVISATFAGLAGSMKSVVLGFATLTDAQLHTSAEVVLMTLLGGVGTLLGPVVGAFVIGGLQSGLADKAGSWVTVILGVLFVFCVLAFRKGIVGEFISLFDRKDNKSEAGVEAEAQKHPHVIP